MKQVNNKNGIKMFWERANDVNKINILDSDGNYFNDLYFDIYDNDDGKEEITAIIHTLEITDLQEMTDFFNAQAYETLEELAQDNYLEMEETKGNDYINRFEINGKSKYTWSY